MSTGYEHQGKDHSLSFESIDRHVRAFDIQALTSPAAVQTSESRTQRLVTVYATARPILVAVTAIPFIPASWRAVLAVFTATLDEISASFRFGTSDAPEAGKPGVIATMEPKLPAGREDEQ